jgi:putative oxidoreductase
MILKIISAMPGWFFKNTPTKADAMSALLSAYRIFAGLIILPYGVGKIKGYEKLSENFFNDPLCLGNVVSLNICIFQQVFCAGLLVLGIQSRFAAFMLFTNMVVATQVHYFDPFVPTSSLPIICMAMYAFLTLAGGGKFSVDNLLFRREEYKAPDYSNIGYGLRAGMIVAASAIAWCSVEFSEKLGILGGYAALGLICIMYAIAIYGFCPFRYMTSKIFGK